MNNWTEWHGADRQPVDDEIRVDVRFRNGELSNGWVARYWVWKHIFGSYDIIAYRLHAANDNHPQEDVFMAGKPKNPSWEPTAAEFDELRAAQLAIFGGTRTYDNSACQTATEITQDTFETFVAPYTPPPTDVKAAIADEAKRIVTGARRAAYGKPEDNFARIAAYWNAYAQCKGWSVVFAAADVSPMMRGMKEARLCETPDHRDSFVDLVGYTLTGAEINGVAA